MARVIFEGFKDETEARDFGMRVLREVRGYSFKPGALTYDGDLMCEVEKKPWDSNTMTLTEG
jgi:hypothetical protein